MDNSIFTYQTTDEAQDSVQQEANSRNDLNQGLSQEAPERTQFFLRMGHAVNLALGIVDCLRYSTGELIIGTH